MLKKLIAAVGVIAATSLIAVGAGCASEAEADVPTGADVKGTWVQEGAGYENGTSIRWTDQTVVINAADGQGFAGYREYTPADGGEAQREALNGVIGLDGEVFIADADGFYEGQFEDGAFVGEYVEVGSDATAMNVTLTRRP